MKNLSKTFFLLTVFFLLIGFFLSNWHIPQIEAQEKPLTYREIITALNTAYPNSVFKTKLLAINHIIKEVKRRGIERELSDEMERTLRESGATDELIAAIKRRVIIPNESKTFTNSIGMEFVLIPSGSFMIGSSLAERTDAARAISGKASWFSETPTKKITINYQFYIGKYEVTIRQWLSVMENLPNYCNWRNEEMEAKFKEFDNQPIVCVSWNEAKEFIRRLNAKNDGYEYRLPSESEWEYAARAGTTSAFAFGNILTTNQANFNGSEPLFRNAPMGKSLGKTVPVGSYQPNAWGLYDMHGNVSELVEDYATNYIDMGYKWIPTDGSPNIQKGKSGERINRGGDWNSKGHDTRSASRSGTENLDIGRNSEGFRLVATPK